MKRITGQTKPDQNSRELIQYTRFLGDDNLNIKRREVERRANG
jgi:hypothetical protein